MQNILEFVRLKDLLQLNQVNKYWNIITNDKIYRQLSIPQEDIDDTLPLLLYSLKSNGRLVVQIDFGSLLIGKSEYQTMKNVILSCPNLISLYWDHCPLEILKDVLTEKLIHLTVPRDTNIRMFEQLQHVQRMNMMSHVFPLDKIPFSNNLQSIYMFKCTFIGNDLNNIVELDNLKSLTLDKCKLTFSSLTATKSNITKLSLDSCTTSAGIIDWISESFPYLEILWLWLITVSRLKPIKSLKWLRIHSPSHSNIFQDAVGMPIQRLELIDYAFSSSDHVVIRQMPLKHVVLSDCTNCVYDPFRHLESIAVGYSLPHPLLSDLYGCSDVRLYHMRLLTDYNQIASFLMKSAAHKLYISESLVEREDRDRVKTLGKVVLCEDQLGMKMTFK